MSEILSLKDELDMISARYNEYWSTEYHSIAEMLEYINEQLKTINKVTKIIAGTTLVGNYKNIAYDNNGNIIEKNIDIDTIIDLDDKPHESVSEIDMPIDSVTILNREMDAWGVPKSYMCREIISQLVDMVENGVIEPTDCLTYDEFKTVIGKLASIMNVSYNAITTGLNAMIKKADFSKSIMFKDFNNTMTNKHTVLSRFIAFIADNAYD